MNSTNVDTTTVTISVEVVQKLREFVFKKHKKFRGHLREYTEKAIIEFLDNSKNE